MGIQGLIREIDEFVKERDWEQYHTPKNIAMSISIESGELLECLQWDHMLTSDELMSDSKRMEAIADEVADIQTYLLRMCSILEINPIENVRRKLKINHMKYPKEKFSGSSRKYNS